MPDFYILNDVTPVQAESAEEAVRQYTKQAGITAGAILIAKGVKSFDVSTTPAAVIVQARP